MFIVTLIGYWKDLGEFYRKSNSFLDIGLDASDAAIPIGVSWKPHIHPKLNAFYRFLN